MALDKCKECGGQVSSEAMSCPHCGAPDPAVGLSRSISKDEIPATVEVPGHETIEAQTFSANLGENVDSPAPELKPLNELRGGIVFKIAKYGLWIQLFLLVAMIISGFTQVDLLQKMDSGFYQSESIKMRDAEANDSRESALGLIFLAIWFPTSISVLMWIFKAHKNALRYGVKKKFSAGWAVGSFFVPIITLIRPYQAMKELHLCSEYPISWQNEKTDAIFPIWWTLWLVTGLIDQFILKWFLKENDPSLSELIYYTYLDNFSSALGVILILVFVKIISTIHQNQKFQYLA
jgi:hypothetical protein